MLRSMWQLLTLLISLVLCFSFTACASGGGDDNSGDDAQSDDAGDDAGAFCGHVIDCGLSDDLNLDSESACGSYFDQLPDALKQCLSEAQGCDALKTCLGIFGDDDTGDDDAACEGCLIEGDCVEDGTVNADNVCLVCDIARSATDWSGNDGAACDDGVFCNGADQCRAGACAEHEGGPCPDDGLWCNGAESCDEENEQCVHSGDRCPDDGVFCNGTESCDESADSCGHSGDPCPDDGVYCNGTESCEESAESCGHSGYPCPGDGVFCNGVESCDEATDSCGQPYNPCPDDGLYCDGAESCDEASNACEHGGNPCSNPYGICDESLMQCLQNICYLDQDGDGYGNPAVSQPMVDVQCPVGWVEDNTDCDDGDFFINTSIPELPGDGMDQDCNGTDLIVSDGNGVFVAKTGDNANPGTMALPKLRIAVGIALAQATGKSVFVAEGDYNESPTTTVSLFGGYESAGWTRDIAGHVTAITAEAGTETTLTLSGASPIAVQGFTINGGSGSNSAGVKNDASGMAVLADNAINGGTGQYYNWGVFNSGTARLANNTINGGSGGDWTEGVANGGTVTLENNTIHGGSGIQTSAGVENGMGTATLTNNTIDGGSGSDSYDSYGMEIYDGSVTLTNNVIDGGSGSDVSYGVYNFEGTATLVNNMIDNGSGSVTSFGVDNYRGTVTLEGNTIEGGSGSVTNTGLNNKDEGTATLANNTIRSGSGRNSYGVNNSGVLTLTNSVIDGGTGSDNCYGVNNSGTFALTNNVIDGGSGLNISFGVYNDTSGEATLVNNAIDGGTLSLYSYGVLNHDEGTATLVNNTIAGGSGSIKSIGVMNWLAGVITLVNNAIDGGSGGHSYGVEYQNTSSYSDHMTLINNDIWGSDQECMVFEILGSICINQLADVNACGWSGCLAASGNISAGPLFIDPANGDFHLQSGSPCVDAGINPAPTYIDHSLAETDFEGDARPYGGGWDIGADEWKP